MKQNTTADPASALHHQFNIPLEIIYKWLRLKDWEIPYLEDTQSYTYDNVRVKIKLLNTEILKQALSQFTHCLKTYTHPKLDYATYELVHNNASFWGMEHKVLSNINALEDAISNMYLHSLNLSRVTNDAFTNLTLDRKLTLTIGRAEKAIQEIDGLYENREAKLKLAAILKDFKVS